MPPRKNLKLVSPRLNVVVALMENYEAVKYMAGGCPPHPPPG